MDAIKTRRGGGLIVTGPAGCGKTTSIMRSAEARGLTLHHITSEEAPNAKVLADLLQKTSTYSLMNILNNAVDRTKIVLIDDVDSIIAMDRNIPSTICDHLLHLHIICTATALRKWGDLAKRCQHVALPAIPTAGILSILRKRSDSIPLPKLERAAAAAGGDIRRAIHILETDVVASAPDVHNVDLYRAPTREAAARIFEEDRTMPLRFHENLLRELTNRKGDRRGVYLEILWSLVEWDQFMGGGHAEVAADLIAGAASTILPRLDRIRAAETRTEPQDFTKMLSRLSIAKKNARHNYSLVPWREAAYAMIEATKK